MRNAARKQVIRCLSRPHEESRLGLPMLFVISTDRRHVVTFLNQIGLVRIRCPIVIIARASYVCALKRLQSYQAAVIARPTS